jgi:uncharacterized lipoprotein YmbA
MPSSLLPVSASSAAAGRLRRALGACGGAALVLLLAAAAGCSLPQAQPDLTRYYVLTAAAPATAANAAPAEPVGPRVYLRAVTVPEYLRGKIMVVRLGQNEVRYVDDARWAEPLEPGLARVLREDLTARRTVQVVLRATDEHDFDAVINVRHCEGVLPARTGQLEARIELSTTGVEPKHVAQEDFAVEVAGWDGRDYAQLAGKLSEAVGALAERFAAVVPQKKP